MPRDLELFGIPRPSSGVRRTASLKRRRAKRRRAVRNIRKGKSETRLTRIVTETTRFHEPVRGVKGGAPAEPGKKRKIQPNTAARRAQLIKAMKASMASPNTPPQLKAGMRRKLKEMGAI